MMLSYGIGKGAAMNNYNKNDMYNDYSSYSFAYRVKRTVYKWWCVVYCPVYKLTHHGQWPEEKNPDNKYPITKPAPADDYTAKLAHDIIEEQQPDIESMILSATEGNSSSPATEAKAVASAQTVPVQTTPDVQAEAEPEIDLSTVDTDTLNRANEIMERLAREAAEDEAKKQREIEEAKKKALEQETLAKIMNANKVDITSYIEEGKRATEKQ